MFPSTLIIASGPVGVVKFAVVGPHPESQSRLQCGFLAALCSCRHCCWVSSVQDRRLENRWQTPSGAPVIFVFPDRKPGLPHSSAGAPLQLYLVWGCLPRSQSLLPASLTDSKAGLSLSLVLDLALEVSTAQHTSRWAYCEVTPCCLTQCCPSAPQIILCSFGKKLEHSLAVTAGWL